MKGMDGGGKGEGHTRLCKTAILAAEDNKGYLCLRQPGTRKKLEFLCHHLLGSPQNPRTKTNYR